MRQEFGRRDPPVPSVVRLLGNLMPDPGRVFNDVEASDDKGPQEQKEQLQGRIVKISPPTRPGATARRQWGVFPSGFPPHVEDFGPPHRLTVIEPTAGGQHR